jgi:hypothetical protein
MEKFKFSINRSSSLGSLKPKEYIEFETLQELLKYVKGLKHELIISFNHQDQEYELEIYDTHRE